MTSYPTSQLILPYLQALLSAPWRLSLVYLSSLVKVSHDYLTRLLVKRYPWRELFWLLLNRHELSSGYLIVDETEVDKSYAKEIEGLGWFKSYKLNKYIFGLHLVVLVWSDGTKAVPLGWEVYRKGGDQTKIDLAKKLLAYGIEILGIKPKAVLFDSYYASEDLLKYLIKQKLVFCSQLPKNRLFNHRQLRAINRNRPYWMGTGYN